MTPRQVLEQWIQLFNRADAVGITTLYHEDAINHQVANEPVIGRDAIREMFTREFAAADMVCIPEIFLKMASGPYWNGKTLKKCVVAVSSISQTVR